MSGEGFIYFILQEIVSGGMGLLFEKFQRRDAVAKAYERALDKWCKNDNIACSSAIGRCLSIDKLTDAITHNSIDAQSTEVQQLVALWEEELRKDPVTHLALVDMYIQRVDYKQEQLHSILTQQFGSKTEFYSPASIINYIPRTVRTYAKVESFADYYHHPERYQNCSLYEYLISQPQCRCVLYSEAQCGKTTEMKHLAHLLQMAGGFRVSLFELRYYLYGQLERQCNKNGIFEPSATSRPVLLLDGLDEIRDEERAKAIAEIEYLMSEHPQVAIVVSCRGNYKATNHIDNFDALYLDQIRWSDVKEYAECECKQADEFLASVEKNELHHLCFTPFFLAAIVEYYNSQRQILHRKSDIYDYVIKCGLKRDKTRNATKGGVYTFEQRVVPLLERVAFVMQSAELQEISLTECEKLGLSESDITECQHSSIFHKSEHSIGFVHNAFEEYLVAKMLSKLPFERVKELVCYSQCEIIRPHWYNTLVLYVDMQNDDGCRKTILEWLVEKEPLVVIKSDCHNLSLAFRQQLFEAIYTQYQTQRIDLDISPKEDRLLMDLCQSKENIMFIAGQLKDCGSECNAVLRNNLRLLHHADFGLLGDTEVAQEHQLLLDALRQFDGERNLAFFYFEPYEHRVFHTEQYIAELFDVVQAKESVGMVEGMMEVLEAANMCDNYADWIFDRHAKYCCGNHRLGSYGIFEHFDNPNHLLRGLLYISQRHRIVDTDRDSAYMPIEAILSKLRSSELHADHIATLFDALANEAERRGGKIVAEYRRFIFDSQLDTLLYNYIFDSYANWRQNKRENRLTTLLFHSDTFAALLFACATPERICDFYDNDNIERRDRHCVVKALGRIETLQKHHPELRECIEKLLPCDTDDTRIQQEQAAFDILFDTDNFVEEVKRVVASQEELRLNIVNNHTFEGKPLNDAIYGFLVCFGRDVDDIIDKSALYDKLNDKGEVEHFLFGQMCQKLLTADRVVTVSPEHLLSLTTMVYTHIRSGNMSPSDLELIAACRLLPTDEVIEQLLPVSNTQVHYYNSEHPFPTLLDYLFEVKPFEKIIGQMERFIDNIGRADKNIASLFDDWSNTLVGQRLCDSSLAVIKKMLDKLTEQAEMFEDDILAILLHLRDYPTQAVALFEEYKAKLTAHTRLKFYFYRIGAPRYHSCFDLQEVCEYAEEQYELVTADRHSEVLYILLATGSKKGLQRAIELLQCHPWSFNDGVVIDNYDLSAIDDIAQLPLLGKEYENGRQPHTLINSVTSYFRELAMISEDNLQVVMAALSSLAERDDSLSYLNKEVKNIARNFYALHTPSFGIEDAYKAYLQY